jgi:CheY-like chemotaxis protein
VQVTGLSVASGPTVHVGWRQCGHLLGHASCSPGAGSTHLSFVGKKSGEPERRALPCAIVRRIRLEYATRAELGTELSRAEDRELEPPRVLLKDREWVLVVVQAGSAQTAVAAQVIDRDSSQSVRFEPRDWQKLEHFAHAAWPEAGVGVASATVRSSCVSDSRVLVVADPDLQPVLRAMVQACGFEAIAAASAEEAFDQLRDHPVGLLVVDQHLPGMSACEFCRRLSRERQNRRPVLVLAAHQFAAGGQEPSCAAADDYVLAPLRTSELGARMIGLMTRAGLGRATGGVA